MANEKVIGGLLLAASVISTYVNESRLVRSVQSLEEGRAAVVALSEPRGTAENDGRLVLFAGLIQSTALPPEPIAGRRQEETRVNPFVMDPVFGVAVKGVRLLRQVEMLQWVETSHVSTSSTPEDEDRRADDERDRIYMYDLRWRDEVVDSSTFNDVSYWNPPEDAWLYRSLVDTAKGLVVGDFELPDALVDQIQRKDRVGLDAASRRTMAHVLNQRLESSWKATSALANVSIEDDEYMYLRQDQSRQHSELGDLRVSFTVTPNYPVTICAQQRDQHTVAPFAVQNGEKLFLLEDGKLTAKELFDKKSQSKLRENWFYRLFTSVLGFIGFLVLRPLILARFGRLVAQIQQHLLASSLSVALTFSVVGLSWLLHSPLWSLGAFFGGVAPLASLLGLQHRFNSNQPVKND